MNLAFAVGTRTVYTLVKQTVNCASITADCVCQPFNYWRRIGASQARQANIIQELFEQVKALRLFIVSKISVSCSLFVFDVLIREI